MKDESGRRYWFRWRRRHDKAPSSPGQQAGSPRGRRLTAAALAVVVMAGLGWLVTSPLRRPAKILYTPEVDTYVSTAHPNANYGATPTLRIDATPKIRSYLRFRLPGLSGRVVHARLRLWSPTGDLVGFSVHPVASTGWDEMGVTSTDGPVLRDPVATSGPFGPGTWSSADVTSLVGTSHELSVALTTRSPRNVVFDSREAANRPQLVVQTARRGPLLNLQGDPMRHTFARL